MATKVQIYPDGKQDFIQISAGSELYLIVVLR